MERYLQMNTIHDECENENYKITHTVYKPSFRELVSSEFSGQIEGDIITVLRDKKKREIVMSDSIMEKRTNLDFISKANGDVLIGGLGLGMIVLAIQDNPNIKSIIVVELDETLKDLVMIGLKDKFNHKVEIVISDINDFIPPIKYDTIYCDIWNDISGDNWEEMKRLSGKYQLVLNQDGWINHWRKLDTAMKTDDDNKFTYLSEDESISVVINSLRDSYALLDYDEYLEQGFDEDKLLTTLDEKIFCCADCNYWHDIVLMNEDDCERVCDDCMEDREC